MKNVRIQTITRNHYQCTRLNTYNLSYLTLFINRPKWSSYNCKSKHRGWFGPELKYRECLQSLYNMSHIVTTCHSIIHSTINQYSNTKTHSNYSWLQSTHLYAFFQFRNKHRTTTELRCSSLWKIRQSHFTRLGLAHYYLVASALLYNCALLSPNHVLQLQNNNCLALNFDEIMSEIVYVLEDCFLFVHQIYTSIYFIFLWKL